MSNDPSCPYCGGAGQVSGSSGDMEFTFQCVCSGGSKEPVRWLLGLEEELPADEPKII
jgi:hypothetical protein